MGEMRTCAEFLEGQEMDTLPLDYKEQLNPPPRPRANDERFWRQAVVNRMKEIAVWGNGDIDVGDQAIIDSVVDACRRSSDGYSRARHLEDQNMWCVDAELVEILDSFDTYREHHAAVREWVSANKINPKLDIGARVTVRGEVGSITAIIRNTAQYVIQTDKWLESHKDQPSTCGYLEAFERVEDAET